MVHDPVDQLQELEIPSSYHSIPFTQIKVTHVPESSTDVTPVVLVTLNRPKNYNAFTNTMMHELILAYTLFDIDDRVKCVVHAGSGSMFCAGMDLTSPNVEPGETVRDHRDGGGRVALAIARCRKPTIAAIHGHAVGVGITMTLPMNIRIAYAKAKIGFVFARRGLVMEAASSFYLPRLIGALHLCTTGAVQTADHPLLNQLFSETLDRPDAVLPRALELADDIAQNCSAISTHLMKEMIYRNPGSPESTHLLDSQLIFDLTGSKDNKEGIQSFQQKRPAKFEGTLRNDAPTAWPWWEPASTSNRPIAKGSRTGSKL